MLRASSALLGVWLQPRLCPPGHSDLLVASAAKATEYMLETAAASVAAFADHVFNTLLLESGALPCGYLFYKNDSHAAAAAAAVLFGKFLCVPFSKCVSEFDLVSCGNAGNWLSGFLLLCCVFWCQRRDPGKVLPSLLGKGTQRFTSEEVKVPCEVFDLQASTQEAIGETEADCCQD